MKRTNTLHLVLKGKWYDMIASGVKTEEYREIKPYWEKRLLDYERLCDDTGIVGKEYQVKLNAFVDSGIWDLDKVCDDYRHGYKKVKFHRGYHRDAPTMTFKIKHIGAGQGKIEWGAPKDEFVFIIKLGEEIK